MRLAVARPPLDLNGSHLPQAVLDSCAYEHWLRGAFLAESLATGGHTVFEANCPVLGFSIQQCIRRLLRLRVAMVVVTGGHRCALGMEWLAAGLRNRGIEVILDTGDHDAVLLEAQAFLARNAFQAKKLYRARHLAARRFGESSFLRGYAPFGEAWSGCAVDAGDVGGQTRSLLSWVWHRRCLVHSLDASQLVPGTFQDLSLDTGLFLDGIPLHGDRPWRDWKVLGVRYEVNLAETALPQVAEEATAHGLECQSFTLVTADGGDEVGSKAISALRKLGPVWLDVWPEGFSLDRVALHRPALFDEIIRRARTDRRRALDLAIRRETLGKRAIIAPHSASNLDPWKLPESEHESVVATYEAMASLPALLRIGAVVALAMWRKCPVTLLETSGSEPAQVTPRRFLGQLVTRLVTLPIAWSAGLALARVPIIFRIWNTLARKTAMRSE